MIEKKLEDFGSEQIDDPNRISKQRWHPEKARMNLAYWVLGAIFIMFIISVVTDFLVINGKLDAFVSKDFFEICRTGLLPIVTLILGYYFSKNN